MSAPRPILLPANQPRDRFYRGGERIAAFRGEPFVHQHTPEDWIASTTAVAGTTEVGRTVLPDGRRLADAIATDPLAWLGPDQLARHGADSVLLVKLLDAGERLPVHAHPDDDFARNHLDCRNGKTESWIVLESDPDAQMYLGFTRDIPPGTLAAWVDTQDRGAMLSAMHSFAVRPGDTVYVPAGLAHAVGEGILLLELQQAADLSLLLEYDGYAIDGRREGHLGLGFERALELIRRAAVSERELAELRGRWDDPHIFPPAADDFFRAERYQGILDIGWNPSFAILVVTDGTGILTWSGGDDTRLELKRGVTALIPYSAAGVRLSGRMDVLRCLPPV